MVKYSETVNFLSSIWSSAAQNYRESFTRLLVFINELWFTNKIFAYDDVALYNKRIAGEEVIGLIYLLRAYRQKGTITGLACFLKFVFGKNAEIEYSSTENIVNLSIQNANSALDFTFVLDAGYAFTLSNNKVFYITNTVGYIGGNLRYTIQSLLPVGVVLGDLLINSGATSLKIFGAGGN